MTTTEFDVISDRIAKLTAPALRSALEEIAPMLEDLDDLDEVSDAIAKVVVTAASIAIQVYQERIER